MLSIILTSGFIFFYAQFFTGDSLTPPSPTQSSQEIAAQAENTPNVFIVTVAEDADLQEVMKEMEEMTGGKILKVYEHSLHGFSIELPEGMVQSNLYFHNAVLDVEPDLIFKPMDVESDADFEGQGHSANASQMSQQLPTGVNRVNADLSPTAKIDTVDDPMPVNIAIIDTGIDSNNPDLNVVFSKNFDGSGSGMDDNGHGTHVAGVAAARDDLYGIVGVAPGARLYALKVLNSSGSGKLSTVIEAVDWVAKQSEPLSSSGGSDAQKAYEKYMKQYEKALKKAQKYSSRIQQYRDRAEEYKTKAEQNKWVLDDSIEKTVKKLMKNYEKSLKQYEKYKERASKYRAKYNEYYYTRYNDYYARYQESGDVKDLEKAQKYRDKAGKYLERETQYLARGEEYQQQGIVDKNQADKLLANPQWVLSKDYEKNIRKYEKYMAKAESYVQRQQQYTQEAEQYKRQAESYLDQGGEEAAKNPDKIDVVNMSIGAQGTSSALRKAIQKTVERGVVVVVSAGNNYSDIFGPNRTLYNSDDFIPAAYPEALTVSAIVDTDGMTGGTGFNGPWNTLDDTIISFSNSSNGETWDNPVKSPGKGIDVAAPGVNIYSTWLGNGFKYLSGTSMAAPHVAGGAALLIAKLGQDVNKDGKIDGQDVTLIRQLLIDTAEPQSAWRQGSTYDPDPNPEGLLQVSDF